MKGKENMAEGDSAKIARIDQRTINVEKMMETHLNEDTRRFEMVFAHFNNRLDKFEEKLEKRVQPMEDRVEGLWDDMKNREGAFGMGKWVAGVIGGIMGAAATFLSSTHGGGPFIFQWKRKK